MRPVAMGWPARILALAMVVAGCASGATPTPGASPSVDPSGSPPPASPSPTGSPGASGPVACEPDRLVARISRWEGAAGSRIAHVEVANPGIAACLLPVTVPTQLVDASGTLLIESVAAPAATPAAPGTATPSATTATVPAGGLVGTLVRVGNYCGPAPVTPLSVAFVLPGGRLLASPPSPSDDTVPACLGEPGSAGSVEMQPWGSLAPNASP